jgi:6-phosphogluconolactonase
MNNLELIRFADDVELARAAAGQWTSQLESRANASRPYCVALSGGRIARRFFEAVVGQARTRRLPLNSIEFFWGDERCVPPTDSESNFAAARELLLEPLAILPERIHRVRGEDAPNSAAAQAEADLRRIAPIDGASQPVFDLIFLGLGEDGHVASLFPGESEEVIAKVQVYRSVIATKPPPHRITLGYWTIAAAKQVWVLASGPGKENALRDSLAPGGRTPLARVLRLRRHTRIFTDIPKW